MFFVFSSLSKLGQPVPESNFAFDEKSTALHAAQAYVPLSLVCRSSLVNGRSVPFSRRTLYCSGESFFFQLTSFFIFLLGN